MEFRKIDLKTLPLNPVSAIGDDWMLITAGDDTGVNTMTASWGGLGVVWGAPAATVYIRPQRYTYGFVEQQKRFSLCFFDDRKTELSMLGTMSGRDRDKIADAGFTVEFLDGIPVFREARLALTAEVMYRAPLEQDRFLDPSIVSKVYPEKDFHVMYIARILAAYEKA